ncbi:hypothetical protein RYA05_01895 [Pseudomonas syringae pv. actinidiae]|nr:hypothetical protein [Pseudomonas syringae pv. actinidiae]
MQNLMRLPLSDERLLAINYEKDKLLESAGKIGSDFHALMPFIRPNTLFEIAEGRFLLLNETTLQSPAMELTRVDETFNFSKFVIVGDLPGDMRLKASPQYGDSADCFQKSQFIDHGGDVYCVSRDAKASYYSAMGGMTLFQGEKGPWMIPINKENNSFVVDLSGEGERRLIADVVDPKLPNFDKKIAAEYSLFVEQYCVVDVGYEDEIVRGVFTREFVRAAIGFKGSAHELPFCFRTTALKKRRLWIYECHLKDQHLYFYFKPMLVPLSVADVTDTEWTYGQTLLDIEGIGYVDIPTPKLYSLFEGRELSNSELVHKNAAYPNPLTQVMLDNPRFLEPFELAYSIRRRGYFRLRRMPDGTFNLCAKMNKRYVAINVEMTSDSPPTFSYLHQLVFKDKSSDLEYPKTKKWIDTECFIRNYRQNVELQFHDDSPLSELKGPELSFDLFRILDTGEKSVALYTEINGHPAIALGWEHKLGSKVQIHTVNILDVDRSRDIRQSVMSVALQNYENPRLDMAEIRNLPDHGGIANPTVMMRVRSLQTYAYHSKTECYVDLIYSMNNTVEKIRYNILGREHISKRNLKACAEAMAIRNFLITRLGTGIKVTLGSQSLRLKISSGRLYSALKGDLHNFMDSGDWPFVRYVCTRAYDTPVLLENVQSQGTPHQTVNIDLGRDAETLKMEECINVGRKHYFITHHAVQRSAERMEMRSLLSGWGFITQKILQACGTPERESKLIQRHNEKFDSIANITPDGWTYVTQPDEDVRKILAVVTTFKSEIEARTEVQTC